MIYIQLESLRNLQKKHGSAKYRKYIALTAAFLRTALLGVVFVTGLFHFHADALAIDPPMPRSVLVRPEYPVSTFLDERGLLRWFIAVLPALVGVGLAIASLGPGCVVVTAGVAIAGCVLAAVGGHILSFHAL